MANDKTITSANSELTFVVAGLFPAPVQIQGYATDKSFSNDALDIAESMIGVDGKASFGYTPNLTKLTVTLQADSVSKDFFATLIAATKTAREVFIVTANLTLPSTGETFAFTRGTLTNVKQIPDGQKVLQPQDYVFMFESVNRAIL